MGNISSCLQYMYGKTSFLVWACASDLFEVKWWILRWIAVTVWVIVYYYSDNPIPENSCTSIMPDDNLNDLGVLDTGKSGSKFFFLKQFLQNYKNYKILIAITPPHIVLTASNLKHLLHTHICRHSNLMTDNYRCPDRSAADNYQPTWTLTGWSHCLNFDRAYM